MCALTHWQTAIAAFHQAHSPSLSLSLSLILSVSVTFLLPPSVPFFPLHPQVKKVSQAAQSANAFISVNEIRPSSVLFTLLHSSASDAFFPFMLSRVRFNGSLFRPSH